MDKSCHSGDNSSTNSSISTNIDTSTNSNNNNNRDQFLRHLNKLSHKISKPPTSNPTGSLLRRPPLDPPVRPLPPPAQAPPLQQQPPVYNINKSDFRDVVQKLTGSPAHENRIQSPAQPPPSLHTPKPASSRLQRIRPPPLAQLSHRPPPLLNCAANPNPNPTGFNRQVGVGVGVAPLSPLPPLPSCHAAAESPISAYMRFLHGSISAFDSDLRFPNRTAHNNPHNNNLTTSFPMNPPSSSTATDSSSSLSSPLPSFPKSPCPLLSPNLLFSPTGNSLGFPNLPVSPTVPGVPSPK